MEEITLDGTVWLSTRRAAELTGYTSDYVGQLARGGKVLARLVGRNWYVGKDAILAQKFGPYAAAVATGGTAAPVPQAVSGELQSPSVSDTRSEVVSAPAPAAPAKSHEETLKEIQEAWETWFTVRPAASVGHSVPAPQVENIEAETTTPTALQPLSPGEERISIHLLRRDEDTADTDDARERRGAGEAAEEASFVVEEKILTKEPLLPLALAGTGRGLLAGAIVAALLIAATYSSTLKPIAAGIDSTASVVDAVRDFLAQTRYVDK